MKHNIDDLGDRVKEACNDLTNAGGVKDATEEDWQAFGAAIDKQLERSRAYRDEMNDIMKMINPNSKESKQDSE